MLPFFEEALPVIRCLERLNISYMVAGSLAMSLHGVLRATHDADLVVALKRGDGRRIAQELGGDYYLDEQSAEEAILRRDSFNIIHIPTAFKVDLFVLKQRAYDQEALRRRTNVVMEGAPDVSVSAETREDVLLAKLRWFRMGGEVSDQQWRDILGILKLQAQTLDMEYLRRWAAEERVLDLLERAMDEAR